MAEYNFEPDYAKWWGKSDLNKEDVIWLLFGINPDDITKQKELTEKSPCTPEEANWQNAFYEYYDEIDSFIHSNFKQRDALLKWRGDKKKLVKDAYELHFYINDNFLNYLTSIGDFERNPNLEAFKDTAKYFFDFKKLAPNNIKTEEEAFSILLGLEPEYFIHFFDLYSHNNNDSKDKKGFSAYIDFTSEDRWFFTSYREFLEKNYQEVGSHILLVRALKKAKALDAWNGDFKQYCQTLHDGGFIFKKEVYEGLNAEKIELEYSDDAWALDFYRYWLKKGGWTLSEALHLFKGRSPDTDADADADADADSFHDLSQNPWVLSHDTTHYWSWDLFKDDYEDLDEVLFRYVSMGKIEAFQWRNKENEYLYAPEQIIPWLMQNTLYLPPKALLQVLEMNESREVEDQRAAENKKAAEAQVQSRKRRSELHDLIGNVIVELGFKDKTAPANNVWKYILNNQDNYDCLMEVTETEITWSSYRGVEQSMKRERFNTIVSEYNTKKREYPVAA